MVSNPQRLTVLQHGTKKPPLDRRYTNFFECFNRAEYFQAHDVLEALWLENGVTHADYGFYKGLIQLAGAFVHMQKHFDSPEHPIHSKRLEPAVRLLQLAFRNLTKYPARYHSLQVENALSISAEYHHKIVYNNYQINPWSPTHSPKLNLS